MHKRKAARPSDPASGSDPATTATTTGNLTGCSIPCCRVLRVVGILSSYSRCADDGQRGFTFKVQVRPCERAPPALAVVGLYGALLLRFASHTAATVQYEWLRGG